MKIYRMPDNLLDLMETNEFGLRVDTLYSRSPYTGLVRESLPTDIRWVGKMASRNLKRDQWTELEAFFDLVRRETALFTLYDPASPTTRGIAAGAGADVEYFDDLTSFDDFTGFAESDAPRIGATGKRGSEFVQFKNLRPNQLAVLKPNDNFSIFHQVGVGANQNRIPCLYKVVKIANSDGQGRSTAEISPKLRYPVADNDFATFVKPRGVFKINIQRIPQVRRSAGLKGDFSFEFVEFPEILDESNVEIVG